MFRRAKIARPMLKNEIRIPSILEKNADREFTFWIILEINRPLSPSVTPIPSVKLNPNIAEKLQPEDSVEDRAKREI